jgi:hypothetical protein
MRWPWTRTPDDLDISRAAQQALLAALTEQNEKVRRYIEDELRPQLSDVTGQRWEIHGGQR